MKKQCLHNRIVMFGGSRIKQVPGFSGYYVGPDNQIYSARGKERKVLKPYQAKKYGAPTGKFWVTLMDDHGKAAKIPFEDVLIMTLGEVELKRRADRKAAKESMAEAKRLNDLNEILGDLF